MTRLVICLVFIVVSPLCCAEAAGQSVEALMSQWLSIESQRGELDLAWRERKQQLQRKIALFDEEIVALKQVIDAAKNISSDVDSRRLELVEKQQSLEAEQARIEDVIDLSGKRLPAVLIKLPPPLQTEWQDKLPLLHRDGVSNSEKLERIFAFLSSVDEFNGRVAMHEGILDVAQSDGIKTIMTTQIYLGVTQGWYITDNGQSFGYGRPTATGWQWWHNEQASRELGQPLHAKNILRIKEILQNPTTAEYISLPVKFSRSGK